MPTQRLGIIMHGVTGRMGMNQHLIRSIVAIRAQGGVTLSNGDKVMPDPILIGRNAEKIEALAKAHGIARWGTDLDAALAKLARQKGIKHGVVQDKLFLPGLRKIQMLREAGFFGRIFSVRGEFGYWVFEGDWGQPAQRPSWNYKKAEGGGIILDMLCHWRYVLDNLFGNVQAVSCLGATHIPSRVDENGKTYAADTDDAAYATFQLEGGVVAHINSSWATRLRRDDLVTFQVDGTHGSAVAGLTRCVTQSRVNTPRPVWNPDVPQSMKFLDQWEEVPDNISYDNGFKIQWEDFIRHVVADTPWRFDLTEGAKGVQLAELGLKSWAERRWIDVPALDI